MNKETVPSYFKYWGKARKREDGGYDYHPLPYHCLDVAAVGSLILHPGSRRNKDISLQTGLSPEAIHFLFVINLLFHDLGKFSICFQSLITELFNELFPEKAQRGYDERHDTLGYVLWREEIRNFLSEKYSILASYLDMLIKTGFGHHGLPPKESAQHGNALLRAKTFFDNDDIEAAKLYVLDVLKIVDTFSPLIEIDKIVKQKLKYVSWQFAGLGIVADWVGSNIDIFPYPLHETLSLNDYWNNYAILRAKQAISQIEWKEKVFHPFSGIKNLFPFIQHPTPLQKYAAETKIEPGSKLWIIEDVTGTGKTETALMLAHRMMASGDADGLYIGLPTMATANAMYERFQKVYKKLYVENEHPSLILSHGMRDLSEEFAKTIGLDGQNGQTFEEVYSDEENACAYCNKWIADNRKKALLADVGVGTIDQALLGVLPARHQSLRLAGLYRKVLIVDEVHAYDAYVEHLLCVLLEAHARNGGSAILLSATIPLKVREKLIVSFQTGLGVSISENTQEYSGFPLVTRVSAIGTDIWPQINDTNQNRQRKMGIEFIHDRENVFCKIFECISQGQCVCWIRNTVESARRSYFELLKRGIQPEKIDLFHSRFAMVDRVRIENAALFNFGKKSGQKERSGRILIATQVVEQSLDLDFDCMISDLAPIDLLIQRAGRIHRHIRDKNGNIKQEQGTKDERAEPVIMIFTPEFTSTPDNNWLSGEFKGTAAVYKHHGRLWLTQKILTEKKEWVMPDDARALIETVYGENGDANVPAGLQVAVNNAQGQIQAQEGMGHLNALILQNGYCRNAVRIDQWNEEEKVQTRLAKENTEIVLAVFFEGRLEPYAQVKDKENAWDWSTLSISPDNWKYSIPEEYAVAAEELKEKYYRLKHSNFVVVTEKSDMAMSSNNMICDYYSPHYGWGRSLNEEA